jgi:hypothetical protein
VKEYFKIKIEGVTLLAIMKGIEENNIFFRPSTHFGPHAYEEGKETLHYFEQKYPYIFQGILVSHIGEKPGVDVFDAFLRLNPKLLDTEYIYNSLYDFVYVYGMVFVNWLETNGIKFELEMVITTAIDTHQPQELLAYLRGKDYKVTIHDFECAVERKSNYDLIYDLLDDELKNEIRIKSICTKWIKPNGPIHLIYWSLKENLVTRDVVESMEFKYGNKQSILDWLFSN